MALSRWALEALLERIKPGAAIASMGYPDILAEPKDVADILGDKLPQLRYRQDSEDICQRHGLYLRPVPDAESFFELLGCSLDVYDIVAERGDEIILDLNYPFPANSCEQYEAVLDVGTLEHCFNIAQALVNMACMLKVGGVIVHDNPWNYGNHGFYAPQPTLFADFYGDNGFRVLESKLVCKDGYVETPKTKRFIYEGRESVLFTVAERVAVQEIAFPVQTKYRKKAHENSREDRNGSSDAGSERGAGGLRDVAPVQDGDRARAH